MARPLAGQMSWNYASAPDRLDRDPLHALTGTAYNWWVQHMSTQTTPGQSFPTPCKRCGGALYPPDDTCPWCGASHAVAYGVRLKASGQRLPPDNPDAPASDVTQSATAHSGDAQSAHLLPLVQPDTPIAPLSMPVPLWKSFGKWLFTKGVILVVLLGALGYGGYMFFGDHSTDSATDEPAAKTATGTIVPIEPSSEANAQRSVASVAPTPSSRPANHVTLPVAPASPTAAPVVLPPLPPRVVVKHRDVPESLLAARTGLQANDLTGAQSALAEVLAAQPDNADARLMQQDLLQREAKRDNALRIANACAAQRQWGCVRRNASDALAIDATSPAAKSVLENAIVQTGWNTPAAPTARGGAQANIPATVARANPPVHATSSGTAAPGSSTQSAASADANSVDARERAIVESGWSHPASAAAKGGP